MALVPRSELVGTMRRLELRRIGNAMTSVINVFTSNQSRQQQRASRHLGRNDPQGTSGVGAGGNYPGSGGRKSRVRGPVPAKKPPQVAKPVEPTRHQSENRRPLIRAPVGGRVRAPRPRRRARGSGDVDPRQHSAEQQRGVWESTLSPQQRAEVGGLLSTLLHTLEGYGRKPPAEFLRRVRTTRNRVTAGGQPLQSVPAVGTPNIQQGTQLPDPPTDRNGRISAEHTEDAGKPPEPGAIPAPNDHNRVCSSCNNRNVY
nr:long-distance movement protein [White snakeroot virus A]